MTPTLDRRVQVFTGPDSVRAADEVRKRRENQENWPYKHVYPPVNSIPVHAITTALIPTPVAASQVEVLAYQVPSGYLFILQAVVQAVYPTTPFVPGDFIWTVDVNTPLGVTSVQSAPVQGLTAIPVQLGSFTASAPWRLNRAYEFQPLDILRSKATTGTGNVGAPNYLVSGFFGYLVPAITPR